MALLQRVLSIAQLPSQRLLVPASAPLPRAVARMACDAASPLAKRPRLASGAPLRVGLVGLGAIGSRVAEALGDGTTLPRAELAAALVARPRPERPACCGERALLTHEPEAFLAAQWDVCVEAAGQPWLREHGRRVLMSGRDLLVTSIGAFTDDALHEDFVAAAEKSGARLLLAAGAMPGIDWMSSAALEGIAEARLVQRKRPEGWKGTPAEGKVDLDSIDTPTVIFEGVARQAAAQFPKNANIAAMLAIATVGLDKLQVQLVADPTVSAPASQIKLRGDAGELSIEVQGAAISQRTSRIVPLSVVKALRNLSSTEVVGV